VTLIRQVAGVSHWRILDPIAPTPDHRLLRLLSRIVVAAAVVIGVGLVLVAATVGDCSAFGGRCPADPEPLLQDDTFGMSAFGAALASAVPLLLARPSWRRAAIAIAVGLTAALLVGLVVRNAANG
jgi:hypothetical protein